MVITVVANPVISTMSQRDFHDEQVTTTTTMTTSSQVQVAPECSTSLSLPMMTSSGPTDRQHQNRSIEAREGEGEEDQQVSDSKISNGNNQGLASPLSASFSFNSYQDILCSASGPGCTFSASDVKRTLSNNCNTINATSQTFKSPVGTLFRSEVKNIKKHQPSQLHQQIVNSKPVNFRLHSRQKSIGKLNELLNAQQSLVANLVPTEQRSNKQQHLQSSVPHSTKQLTYSSNNSQIESDQTKICVQSLRETTTTTTTDKILNRDHPDEEKYDPKLEMSQTIQSIQSLSMQLNQASNLRHSNMSELSRMSSIGSQSANGAVADHHHHHHQQQQQQQQQENFMTASSGKLARFVGKKASRVKELVLQNLGKADKTTDDLFQMYEENFYKQQNHALKLQKEFKTYINALKDAHITNKSLNSCIQQSTGDYQSARHDLVCENLSQLEHLNDDLLDKLRSQVLVSVNEYTSQFTKLCEKIAKRKRKLIDYDSSKRVYELMLASVNKKRAQVQRGQQEREQQNQQQAQVSSSRTLSRFILGSSHNNQANDNFQSATNQLIDEARLLKLREQYNYCKIMYETINNELYDELPMVYEKKMKHLLMTLQNYFSIEAQHHSNAGKLYATASDVIDELPMSIHLANKRNNINHHQHHHQSSNMNHSSSSSGSHTNVNDGEEYNSKVAQITSGSSGVGSSRGDSSLESSSSPEAASSSGNSSPSHQQVGRGEKDDNEDEGDDDDTGENDVHVDDNENEDRDEDEDGVDNVDVDVDDDDDDGVDDGINSTIGEYSNTDIKVMGVKKQLDMSQSGQTDNSTDSGKEQSIPKQEKFSPVVCSDELLNGRAEQHGNVQSCLDHQFTNMQQVISRDLKEELKAVVKGKEALKNKISNELVFEDSRKGQVDARIERDKESELDVKSETRMGEKNSPSSKSDDSQKGADKISDFKCLYKVKTIYKYLAEDVDELCFEADELIQVIEFDETEEQEEGWLKGMREVSGQVGLFPANFTQPI